jgi:hypothetical protein
MTDAQTTKLNTTEKCTITMKRKANQEIREKSERDYYDKCSKRGINDK